LFDPPGRPLFNLPGANRRWRCQFRYRGSRHESAVAQLSTLGRSFILCQMKRIRIYRHPDCPRCAKIAATHHRFDWLNRVEDTTVVPPTGPLRIGQIIVEDLQTRRFLHGAEAFEMICRLIPAYLPFRILLWLPAFRRYVERDMSGCKST
jgi:hypothetical protein